MPKITIDDISITQKENKKLKQFLTSSNILKLNKLPLSVIINEFNSLSAKELLKINNKEFYGVPFSHIVLYHNDSQVLKYFIELYKKHNLNFTFDLSKTTHSNFSIFKDETPLNIALRLHDLNKAKILIENGFDDINFNIPKNDHFYTIKTNNINNIFEFILYLNFISPNPKYIDYITQKINKDSFKNFDFDQNFIFFKNILSLKEIYQSKDFIENIPLIINSLQNKTNTYFKSEANAISILSNIFEYSPSFFTNKDNVKNIKKFLVFNERKEPYLVNLINTLIEKATLSSMVQNTSNQKINKI